MFPNFLTLLALILLTDTAVAPHGGNLTQRVWTLKEWRGSDHRRGFEQRDIVQKNETTINFRIRSRMNSSEDSLDYWSDTSCNITWRTPGTAPPTPGTGANITWKTPETSKWMSCEDSKPIYHTNDYNYQWKFLDGPPSFYPFKSTRIAVAAMYPHSRCRRHCEGIISKVYLTNATFEITSSGTFLPNGTNIYTASKPSNAGCSYPVPEFGPSENCVAERDLHLVVTTALITREEYYAMGLGYPSNATVAPRSNSSAPKTSATGLSKALYADAKNDMR